MARRPKDVVTSKIHDIGEIITNKFLLNLPFTPNQLTVINFLFLIIAAFLFSFGKYPLNLLAFFSIIISTQIDFADGIVARHRGLASVFGAWFDPFLDLLGQQIIIIGISFGVMRNYDFNSWVVLLCFLSLWSIILNNVIGLEFNKTFGFNSYIGLEGFTEKFNLLKKIKVKEELLFNLIAPHRFIYFVLFTLRYFLIFGICFNQMLVAVVLITFFGLLRAICMIVVYGNCLLGNDKNKIIKILIGLAKERNA